MSGRPGAQVAGVSHQDLFPVWHQVLISSNISLWYQGVFLFFLNLTLNSPWNNQKNSWPLPLALLTFPFKIIDSNSLEFANLHITQHATSGIPHLTSKSYHFNNKPCFCFMFCIYLFIYFKSLFLWRLSCLTGERAEEGCHKCGEDLRRLMPLHVVRSLRHTAWVTRLPACIFQIRYWNVR